MRHLLYIVILLFTGCSYTASRPKVLDEAQRLMTEDPQAALSCLNSLDISELDDSATMADEFQKASRLKAIIKSYGNHDELAKALYLQKEKEFMLYKERAAGEKLFYITIIVIMLAAGTIIWMRQRLRLQSAKNDALMAEASGLKTEIEARSCDVSRLQNTLHSLLDNRFSLIDSLCQTYYESQGTRTERKAIAEKVKAEIEAVRTDSFPKMERVVNDCRNNILERVRQTLPDIKPEDYQLAVYLAFDTYHQSSARRVDRCNLQEKIKVEKETSQRHRL